jgi:hypothetical protein
MGGATGSPKWHMKWGVRVNSEVKPVATKINCTGCVHLYLNNDGSYACDHPYERICLDSGYRVFKEVKNA